MKKILSIALCAVAVSAFSASTETILGQVGVTAITTSLSNAIVAVSYNDLAGGEGMVCSNLVKTTNLTEGDMLVEFRDDKYTGWMLMEDQGTKVKYWKEQMGAFVDSAGKQLTLVGSSADTVTNMVGTGIWLVRKKPTEKNPTDGEEVPVPFYIYGKPVTSPTSKTVADTWTLIGNPTQGTVEITAARFGQDELSEGDEIVIPVAPSGNLSRYTFSAKYGWRTTGADGEWVKTSPSLGAGLGCWIRTTKAASISWISQ